MARSVRPLRPPFGKEQPTPPPPSIPAEIPVKREVVPVGPESEPFRSPIVLPQPKTLDEAMVELVRGLNVILTPHSTFVTGNVICPVANRAYQLPSFDIPWNMELVVKALFTNVGTIYIASRAADAASIPAAYPLIANEAIGYRIRTSSIVWVMATTAGEGVSYTVEQK